ncbi:MAG: hypothetical protein HC853_05320 [Anaerolineae bacterium]|nr:hypothetical protein [Anaerolineae bacterium]
MDTELHSPVSADAAQDSYHSYHSFLVRLWRQAPDAPWRASAQSVQSGQARHFADMNALFQFLGSQVSFALPDKQAETKSAIQTEAPNDE